MTSATNSSFGVPTGQSPIAARAAMMLIFVGGIEILSFGLLALGCLKIAATPIAELQEQLKFPAEQLEQLAQSQALAIPFAVAFGLLGVVPGISYILLSFGVRALRYVPTQIALLFVATQLIAFGIVFVMCVGYAMLLVNPVAVTAYVLTLGTLLMLLGFTFRNLLQARLGAKLRLTSDREPWDSPDE